MNGIKRIFLCFLVIVLLLPLTTHAQQIKDQEALEQAIIESCYYGIEIDVTDYEITYDEMFDLFYAMHDAGKLPWYTAYDRFYYHEDPRTGYLMTFRPKMLSYDKAVYEHRLEEILQACVLPGMADWQIALALHDYLIVHTVYDEFLRKTDGYSLLVDGKTVCAGYTEVYRELLNRAGVPCVSVASDPMNHIWNLVQIGGKWYHVDVTWDDPTPDVYGYVSHEYFLVTDEQIAVGEDPHYDWVTDIQCTDTTFTDWFFRDVESAVSFTDADTCYFLREKKFQNHIYKHTVSTGKETTVYKEKNVYTNAGKGNYYYQHFGLSVWNGRLWLNSLKKIVSMDLNGKDIRTELTYSTKAEKQYIIGAYVDKDKLRFTTSTHGGDFKIHERPLKATNYHVHKYTRTIVPPTCGADGYTQSECSCGIHCQSTPVKALTHEWQTTRAEPTLRAEGYITESCIHCGESRTEMLPKLELGDWLQDNMSVVLAAVVLAVLILVVIVVTVRKKKKSMPVPVMTEEESMATVSVSATNEEESVASTSVEEG